uniref:Uncharacterized protein n=1 Tax=Anguilla anguilla TaxID=7936 RepID=A0A0E9UM54_ANGAN
MTDVCVHSCHFCPQVPLFSTTASHPKRHHGVTHAPAVHHPSVPIATPWIA